MADLLIQIPDEDLSAVAASFDLAYGNRESDEKDEDFLARHAAHWIGEVHRAYRIEAAVRATREAESAKPAVSVKTPAMVLREEKIAAEAAAAVVEKPLP